MSHYAKVSGRVLFEHYWLDVMTRLASVQHFLDVNHTAALSEVHVLKLNGNKRL